MNVIDFGNGTTKNILAIGSTSLKMDEINTL